MPHTAAVVTVSDRSAAGERPDSSGPIAVAALRAAGFACEDALVVPDGADSVERALQALAAGGARVIVTTGGTGVGPRDQTPEGTLRVIDRELPGIGEELRRRGVSEKPAAMLSRGVAGIAARSLIVNLPGSTAAVRSGMPVILAVAGHVIDQLDGGDH
ncbi:MogA/MoaB family molybdenum cofactor biosynthesis protein [Microbacterium sp. ARD31]|jgi:molybdenum cofactor synthesis domain-containing protein|uniref:MogA/MoaB family molybdenum cofactor biosynthesis protein n=1 Tax=unclassified Microbacterium TaxID=2609290 RepID=UPI00203CA858|nr:MULTISPECIES: MogA/MoaB family molybdenum cofactor biosynthesis protein [unclassified Microbacterium]MDT0180421.1 MogA/MoaB family molybdenum cofactor biosynthesis protein [Microbacterium sp. ARD31]